MLCVERFRNKLTNISYLHQPLFIPQLTPYGILFIWSARQNYCGWSYFPSSFMGLLQCTPIGVMISKAFYPSDTCVVDLILDKGEGGGGEKPLKLNDWFKVLDISGSIKSWNLYQFNFNTFLVVCVSNVTACNNANLNISVTCQAATSGSSCVEDVVNGRANMTMASADHMVQNGKKLTYLSLYLV